MKWLRKMKIEGVERREEESHMLSKQEIKKNTIELQCKCIYKIFVVENNGVYNFFMGEDKTSFEEYIGKEETELFLLHMNDYYHHYKYYPYFVHIVYDVEIIYNKNNYKLNGRTIVHRTNDELDVYKYIYKILKGDKMEMDSVMAKIKDSVLEKFNKLLAEENANEVKQLLEENNEFKINFTILTDKTSNMI